MSSGPVQAGLAPLPCASVWGMRTEELGVLRADSSAEGPMGALPRISCSVCSAQLGPGVGAELHCTEPRGRAGR